ncbi:putative transmembrane protein [Gregarina niphandrodes]|uniref:Transmembrane protein n=1 Tax=Gregarina niphandrodes TaxID=110365 RepID=A0A023AZS4_GRENI|nr:putative transmembrane protein [Gregarina niphandrodes]EZG44350.1 putative transmembrane protein [Gregarina niphandrodes]|eukprot:XP_011132697.1 putative transmembrane protein [Gregarina niphandrodes]
MTPRILFIHSFRGHPSDFGLDATLREIYGPDNVACPELGTAGLYRAGRIALWVILFLAVAVSVVCVICLRLTLMSAIAVVGSFCSGILIAALVVDGLAAWALHKAKKIAREHYDRLQPNVIVATGAGAFALRKLRRPKTAVLLVRPGVIQFERYTGRQDRGSNQLERVIIEEIGRWSNYPYVLIVEEEGAKHLGDQAKLQRRMDPSRSRLLLFEPNTISQGISSTDLQGLIHEVYERGKCEAAELAISAPDAAIPVQMF